MLDEADDVLEELLEEPLELDDDEVDDWVAAGLELGVAAGDGALAGAPWSLSVLPSLGRSTCPLKGGESDGEVRMNTAAATPANASTSPDAAIPALRHGGRSPVFCEDAR